MKQPNHKLKIGLVLDDGLDKPDGVQQYVLGIGEWLRDQGHDVHYLVGQTSRTDIMNTHSLSKNITVRFNGNQNTMPLPTSRKKLRAFLQQQRFDVLHVQMPYSPFMGHRIIMAADARTAIIGSFHVAPNGKLMAIGTAALGVWLKSSLKRFDSLLSVSTAAQGFARQTFNIDTTLSPNVVDYQRFMRAKPLPIYANSITTILFLGRLVPRKGCKLLLEAVVVLSAQPDIPNFRVVICGRGQLESQLRKFVADHNLTKKVEFTGFISETDKPRYYASADISVFPSSGGESFGIVLLEAMASGKAVVLAGDNPGYRSVMAPQPDALFDPRSAQDLADRIAYYIQNDAQATVLKKWGQDYTKNFDITRVGQQLIDIYTQALHKRPNR